MDAIQQKNQHLESLLEITLELKEILSVYLKGYREIKTLMEREHEAIRHSDIAAIDLIKEQKQTVNDSFQEAFERVSPLLKNVAIVCQSYIAQSDPRNVSDIVDVLQIAAEQNSQLDSLSAKIFRHNLQHIHELNAATQTAVVEATPLIERSKFLIEKYMRFHENSLRFWQEVAGEIQEVYDQTGRVSEKASSSILNVKA